MELDNPPVFIVDGVAKDPNGVVVGNVEIIQTEVKKTKEGQSGGGLTVSEIEAPEPQDPS